MNDIVICAEGLGKKYVIGRQAERGGYVALRDVMARTAKGFAYSTLNLLRGGQIVAGDKVEEFWALKDVNFEIRRGDVIGIVGRNGAGKSTLLKILSRITEPSEGRVELRGRVASLLEVGTGFHPELTGRENIYLNGAILGMSRAEIKQKFDEIVAFAEVERFLDTPVKRYSSGMYVRLAFAIAAHLEPEILVVDEVLAVGDAEFQKKCLGKMGEVAGHGRTVLFVSHNMLAVRALCRRGIFLDQGRVQTCGSIEEAVATYIASTASEIRFVRDIVPTSQLSLMEGSVEYATGSNQSETRIILRLLIRALHPVSSVIDIRLKDNFGNPFAFATLGGLNPSKIVKFHPGENERIIYLAADTLAKGDYNISIDLVEPNAGYYDRVEDCLSISIEPVVSDGSIKSLDQNWGLGSIHLSALLVK